jgi:hypothetical protein
MKVGDIYANFNYKYIVKITGTGHEITGKHLKEQKGTIGKWPRHIFSELYVPLTKLHCYLNGIDYERLDIQL